MSRLISRTASPSRLERQPAGDYQLAAFARDLDEISFPTAEPSPMPHQSSSPALETGFRTRGSACRAPRRVASRRAPPLPNSRTAAGHQVADDDGLSRKLQQVRPLAEQIFQLFAAGYIEESADCAAHGSRRDRAAGWHWPADAAGTTVVTNFHLHAAQLLAGGCGALEGKIVGGQLPAILIETKGKRRPILLRSEKDYLRSPRPPSDSERCFR